MIVKPEEQFGTIKVDDDGLYCQYLYRVTAVDTSKPTIKFGDEVILTGPKVAAISSVGPLVIDFDLFCGAYKEKIYIDYFKGISGYPLEERIISEDGTGEICVLYALFNDATEAHLEVKLFTSNNSTADIHGVAVRTSRIEHPAYTSMLFVKKPDYKTKVGHGELAPLSRSIIAVQLEYELFLDIHLRSDDDDEICKGTVSFEPKLSCTYEETLNGNNGDIKVKVTWKGTKAALQGNHEG